MKINRLKFLFYALFCPLALTLTGCSYFPSAAESLPEDTWADSGYVTIGSSLTIQNTDNRLTLQNNIDTLASDGLYYAAWTIGNSVPFENSDGDTVDLYDAQLYLLLGEFPSEENAQASAAQWLSAGKANYEILEEEEITCNGQPYTMITYRCIGEDNPYDRGVSAFGVCGSNAVCVELTCREIFKEDLEAILIPFLNSFHYNAG